MNRLPKFQPPMITVSYSTVALYIRDHGDFGFSGQKITQKPASQYHPDTLAVLYWLGITKPKSAFSTTLNASNRLLQFKKNVIRNENFY